MPVLTITHAAMIAQDGGAMMNAARLLSAAIGKNDNARELELRLHIQSLALSVLHLVNDKEDYTDVTHPGFTEAERGSIAPSEGDTSQPPPDSK